MLANLRGIELSNLWDLFMIPLLWLSIEFSYKCSVWVHILTTSHPLQMHRTLVTHAMWRRWPSFLNAMGPLLTFLKKEESNKTQNVPTRQIFATSWQQIIPLCDSFKGFFRQKKCTKVGNFWNLHILDNRF
jgi:hypothetical protein